MARGAAFAVWWTDHYTRGLPPDVRDRRRAEIASDVFEQLHGDASSRGGVGWRAVRGIPADLAWRREMRTAARSTSRARAAWSVVTQAWFAPLAVLVGAFDLLLALGVALEPGGKLPGRAVGPLAMGCLGVALFVGLWLRWRNCSDASVESPTRGSRGSAWLPGAVALLVVCLALVVVGGSAGSPVVVFAGIAIVAVAAVAVSVTLVARAVRSASASSRAALADGMIVVGVLPALAFFWMIIPPLLAIAVIAGVAGAGRWLESA